MEKKDTGSDCKFSELKNVGLKGGDKIALLKKIGLGFRNTKYENKNILLTDLFKH